MFAHSTPLRATHQLWVIFYGPNKNLLYPEAFKHVVLIPFNLAFIPKRVSVILHSQHSKVVKCTYFMKKICHHPSKEEIPTFLDVSTRHSKFTTRHLES